MSVGPAESRVEEVLAKKVQKPETVYQQLAKAAQRYGKAYEPRVQDAPPPGMTTEVQDLRDRLTAAEAARRESLVDLAQKVAAVADAAHADIVARLQVLEAERGDTNRRRNEFAAAASGYDWRVEHKQDRDFIGPFTIEHKPGQSVIKLGTTKVAVRAFASGAELFEAVKAERARLEVAARAALARDEGEAPSTSDRARPNGFLATGGRGTAPRRRCRSRSERRPCFSRSHG